MKTKEIVQTFLVDVVSAKPPVDDGRPTEEEPIANSATMTRAQLAKLRYKQQQEAQVEAEKKNTESPDAKKPKQKSSKLDMTKMNETEKKQLHNTQQHLVTLMKEDITQETMSILSRKAYQSKSPVKSGKGAKISSQASKIIDLLAQTLTKQNLGMVSDEDSEFARE